MKEMKPKTPIPKDTEAWLEEIASVYCDAQEALPFGSMVDHDMTEADLFYLGPAICLKSRGIKASAANLKCAADAALSSYVATSDLEGDMLDKSQVAFAFCYIASHFGLGLVEEATASRILDHIADNADALVQRVKQQQECEQSIV